MTLNNPNPNFKVTLLFNVECVRNTSRYSEYFQMILSDLE